MRLLIAFIFPWLTFFTIRRPISGIVCLLLQITLFGWLPATIWAVYALSQFKTDEKIQDALATRKRNVLKKEPALKDTQSLVAIDLPTEVDLDAASGHPSSSSAPPP